MCFPLSCFNNYIDHEGKIIWKEKEVTENEVAFICILTKHGRTLVKSLFYIPGRNHRPDRTHSYCSYQVMAWQYQKWRTEIVKYNLCSGGERTVNYSLARSDFSHMQSS